MFHNEVPISGIIGPHLSDVTLIISELNNVTNISLLHIHTSKMSVEYASKFPSTFGVLLLLFEVVINLANFSNWTKVTVIYDVLSTEYLIAFSKLSQPVMSIVPIPILSRSYYGYYHKKFEELLAHNMRIIVLLVDEDLACQLLCVASHAEIHYPAYQWLLLGIGVESVVPMCVNCL